MQLTDASLTSPHLTERQLIWVSHRLSTDDDLAACAHSLVDPGEVLAWRKDPMFNEAVLSALGDKRGTFGPLSQNLLPLALRTLYDLMANGSNRDKSKAMDQLFKIQGLFIDVVRTEDADVVLRMIERMRQPVVVEIANPRPRD